ncbi:MAG: invasion associated locus B family protein [Rhodospirillaceae bacterium]|nr:invasion associated locus B family protein [Rhodospirillaceae bacterium]
MVPVMLKAFRHAPLTALAIVCLAASGWTPARAGEAPAQPTQAAPAPAQPAPAAPAARPRVAGRFKDWAVICIDDDGKPDTPEECYLNDVPNAQDADKLPAVVIGYATTDKGQRLLAIRFYLPPATDKDAGFRLSIGDKQAIQNGEIPSCDARACETRVMPLPSEIVDTMKRGSTMTLGYTLKGGGATTSPISLSGFTAAFNALAQGVPPPAAAAAESGGPQAKFRQKYDSWVMLCGRPDNNPATPEICYLEQTVMSAKQGQALMAARIRYAAPKEGGERKLALQFLFPPATMQAAGFQVMIDDKPVMQGPIVKCDKAVCATAMVMPPELIDLMKKGTKMSVAFTLDRGKTTADLSLKGFTAGLDALGQVKS